MSFQNQDTALPAYTIHSVGEKAPDKKDRQQNNEITAIKLMRSRSLTSDRRLGFVNEDLSPRAGRQAACVYVVCARKAKE